MASPDSTAGFNLDDPDVVKNFINFIPKRMEDYASSCINSGTIASHAVMPPTKEDENDSAVDITNKDHSIEHHISTSTSPSQEILPHESLPTSATATPAEGFRAPPPTPASLAAAIEKGAAHLEPVPEDDILDKVEKFELAAVADTIKPAAQQSIEAAKVDLVDAEKEPETSPKTATILAFDAFIDKAGHQGLGSSKFAGQLSSTARARTHPVLSSRDPNSDSTKGHKTTTNRSETEEISGLYQTMVVEKFRKDTQADIEARFVDPRKTETSASRQYLVETLGPQKNKPLIQTPKKSHVRSFTSNDEVAQDSKPASHDRHVTFDITAAKNALAGDKATIEAQCVKPEIVEDTIAAEGNKKLSEDLTITAGDGQKRDDANYFTNWGTPETRSVPKAEIRRVVLSGLPAAVDDNLVAGLIHGGSLESFTIVRASESAVLVKAVVTFVSGSAAKRYYDKYPNGLVVKLNGKKSVATVDMGDKVDVVSGIMRGYIESGASRVVRAVGADEDWGMRALRKLAEEKGRKVEAIVDTYRDESRTIEFRFTNIADAVAFRAQLTRDIDWEDCTICFGEDPCAKALGPRRD